jgi:hypothetical protein
MRRRCHVQLKGTLFMAKGAGAESALRPMPPPTNPAIGRRHLHLRKLPRLPSAYDRTHFRWSVARD